MRISTFSASAEGGFFVWRSSIFLEGRGEERVGTPDLFRSRTPVESGFDQKAVETGKTCNERLRRPVNTRDSKDDETVSVSNQGPWQEYQQPGTMGQARPWFPQGFLGFARCSWEEVNQSAFPSWRMSQGASMSAILFWVPDPGAVDCCCMEAFKSDLHAEGIFWGGFGDVQGINRQGSLGQKRVWKMSLGGVDAITLTWQGHIFVICYFMLFYLPFVISPRRWLDPSPSPMVIF